MMIKAKCFTNACQLPQLHKYTKGDPKWCYTFIMSSYGFTHISNSYEIPYYINYVFDMSSCADYLQVHFKRQKMIFCMNGYRDYKEGIFVVENIWWWNFNLLYMLKNC